MAWVLQQVGHDARPARRQQRALPCRQRIPAKRRRGGRRANSPAAKRAGGRGGGRRAGERGRRREQERQLWHTRGQQRRMSSMAMSTPKGAPTPADPSPQAKCSSRLASIACLPLTCICHI
eukprot:365003-Chlamydomonas_euryale.AAC.8